MVSERGAIAVKLFGPDLYWLRRYAEQIKQEMEAVEELVDLFVDQQTNVPQVHIRADRERRPCPALSHPHILDLDDKTRFG